MNKIIAGIVFLLGVFGSSSFYTTGQKLQSLQSVSGNTVAEAFYQQIGSYGTALALVTLCLASGIAALILQGKEID